MPIRCLLADDHRILREGVRRLLEETGLEVVAEADTGAAALHLLNRHQPDMLVLDLALPDMPGLDVCRRACAAHVRVVVLTMHVSAEHVRLAREAGASGYVVKGSGIAELAEAIRKVAGGGPGPFPSIATDPLARLTLREREVLVEVAHGRSNKEIASRLGISIHTVNTHRIHLMDKLGVHDAIALTRLAFTSGLLS